MSTGEFSVVPPTDPWQVGAITVNKRSHDQPIIQIHLDKEDVYDAATMRAFGLRYADASPGSVNEKLKDETEFAIESVTVWGNVAERGYAPVTLLLDHADGTPGVAVTDSGDRNRRACVKSTPNRLVWEKYGNRSLSEAFMVVRTGVPVEAASGYPEIGVIDTVVRLRRSFFAIVRSTARESPSEKEMA